MRCQKGFTLLELLVGIFLSGIMLTILVQLFAVSFRIGREELARSSTEASLVVTLKRLEGDLLGSSPSGLTLDPGGIRLVVHPILTVSNRRQVVYEDRLLYWSYDTSSEELVRTEMLSPPTGAFDTQALRLAPVDLAALPLSGTSRLLNKLPKVTEFTVSNPTGVAIPNVGSPLEVALESRIDDVSTRGQVRLVRRVWLRSGAN